MKRSLLSGTALLFLAMFGPAAIAADSGGEQINPKAQISPMTSALVQGAQAKILFPQGGAKASVQNVDPNSATGNPALDRTLGVNASANTPTKALQNNLATKAQTLLQNKQAADAAAQANTATFADGATGNGLQSGGIPVVNVTKNITRNITKNTTAVSNTTTNNVTNQTGNITNVKAVTKVLGNDNTVTQAVQGIGNNNTFKAPN